MDCEAKLTIDGWVNSRSTHPTNALRTEADVKTETGYSTGIDLDIKDFIYAIDEW